ncbi:MAG: hypothetical protein HC849_09585 [Oscillatoriales cyanobacterium RU_3_3]|nr:hypothetical protein [Oscillatoriales cyanobacterium RU_3_3]
MKNKIEFTIISKKPGLSNRDRPPKKPGLERQFTPPHEMIKETRFLSLSAIDRKSTVNCQLSTVN